MVQEEFLVFNSRDELLRLNIDKIVFFEGNGNYTNIVLANNLKGVVCINLAKIQTVLEEKLQKKSVIFARVGKRYIININFIYSINILKQKLTLSDGYIFSYQLNIAKDALKKIKELYYK